VGNGWFEESGGGEEEEGKAVMRRWPVAMLPHGGQAADNMTRGGGQGAGQGERTADNTTRRSLSWWRKMVEPAHAGVRRC
jgi:hypothetical protein